MKKFPRFENNVLWSLSNEFINVNKITCVNRENEMKAHLGDEFMRFIFDDDVRGISDDYQGMAKFYQPSLDYNPKSSFSAKAYIENYIDTKWIPAEMYSDFKKQKRKYFFSKEKGFDDYLEDNADEFSRQKEKWKKTLH